MYLWFDKTFITRNCKEKYDYHSRYFENLASVFQSRVGIITITITITITNTIAITNTMAISNQAAWLDAKGQKLRIGDAEVPELGADDVLVENLAVAINPVDYMMQDSGYFVQNWPAVLGCDLAGEVVSVGSGVTTVTKGQRVLAHPLGLATGKPANSSFQKYTVVQELAVCPIPENMTYEDAAVIPLGLSTALGGLYVDQKQPLPLPKKNPERTGKKVLIWGGSSSVGSAAIQLAVASGFDVVATSSEKNFEHCKKLGAKEVFDYGSKSIAEDLMAALPKEKLAVTFDGKANSIIPCDC